jgi:hypothetical protein
MGFLDHSTNNILLDAVLTREGRRRLARGTFRVDGFSLGDDEVDYTSLTFFGNTVGKEKIEKNTPVFEAQTGGMNSIKHELKSIPGSTFANTFFVPLASFKSAQNALSTSGNILSLNTSTTPTSTVEFVISMTNDDIIPDEFRDSTYAIHLNTNLLRLGAATPDLVLPDGTGIYDNRQVNGLDTSTQQGRIETIQLQSQLKDHF